MFKFHPFLNFWITGVLLIRESNRLKYRSGSGSRNFVFNGSVQVQDFQNLGSGSGSVAPKFRGSVRVHRNQIFKIQVH